QILGPLNLDQNPETLLLRIALLLRLDQPLPDLLVDRPRLVELRGPVEARDAAAGQQARLAQRRLAEIDRDLAAVREIAGGRALAALPEREMLVVIDQSTAAWRDLRITVRQRRPDQADMRRIGRIDVLVQSFRNDRQDVLPCRPATQLKGVLRPSA